MNNNIEESYIMSKEFVTYAQALALKEMGFDEPCMGFYGIDKTLHITGNLKVLYKPKLIAPIFQQASHWFREKHGLYYYIEPVKVTGAVSPIKFDYVILEDSDEQEQYLNKPFHTYEEAELACLNKLIELVKQKI